VLDLVAHDKAGERILEDLLADADRRLREEGIAGDVYVLKNNADPAGRSYVCQENYLVSRQGEFGRLADLLIPFLVTRQVICGAGKVLHGPQGAVYCMSQRARRPAARLRSTAAISGPLQIVCRAHSRSLHALSTRQGRCRNSCALTDSPSPGYPVIVGLRARRGMMSATSGVDVDPPAAQREDPLCRPRHARMWVSRADLVRLVCRISYLVNRSQGWSMAPPRQFVHHLNEVAVSQGQPPRWRRGHGAMQRVGGRQLPLRLQRADREMERLILESGSGTSPELQLCAGGRSQRFTGRRLGCWHPG
jgi:Pup-ligase protein